MNSPSYKYDNDFSLYYSEYVDFIDKPHTVAEEFNSKWASSDTENNFNKLYKLYPKHLQYYKDNPIDYKINKQNFRSDFDYSPNKTLKVDIFLGCSHTFGVGLHHSHNWTSLISQATGNTPINLGASGHGIGMSYLLLKKYINFYNVQNIFHYQPFYSRFLVHSKDKHDSFVSYQDNISEHLKDIYKEEYCKSTLADFGYIHFNQSRYIDACFGLSLRHNAKYFYLCRWPEKHYNIFAIEKGIFEDDDIPARDLIHFSKNMNVNIASRFKSFLNNNNYYIGFKND